MNIFSNTVPFLKGLLVRGFRIARNALIDIRYGGLLGGSIRTRYAHLGAKDTVNTDYMALPLIFENRIKSSDVLVDVGCGKGRVINWWLGHGCRNRIIGLELDGKIAEKTRQRLRRYKNVFIIAGDAIQNLPADGTLFYLYNPFKADIMEAFKRRLISHFSNHDNILILYYNPKYVDVFRNDPLFAVKTMDIGGPSAAPFSQLAVIRMGPKIGPDNVSASDR